ncbi:hypothetical protein PMAYCL1PPCAC_12397, partial [Pristionchus mayeri]
AYPAWVYCTRYSDRPTSGNRSRRHKRKESATEEKRRVRRTAFTTSQLTTLKHQFIVNQFVCRGSTILGLISLLSLSIQLISTLIERPE